MRYIKKYESSSVVSNNIDLGPIKDILNDILDDFNCEISYRKRYFSKKWSISSIVERDNPMDEASKSHFLIRIEIKFFDKDNRKAVNYLNRNIKKLKEYYLENVGHDLIIFIQDILSKRKLQSINKTVKFYITTDKEILKTMDEYFTWKVSFSDQKYSLL